VELFEMPIKTTSYSMSHNIFLLRLICGKKL
jgi:hypothetical protein